MPDQREQQSFRDLMARLQAGDAAAAEQVFHHFSQRLIALARSRLGVRLQSKVDPEDITQSVLRSFYVRQGQGQFQIENWESLWGLLVVLTLRKCGHRTESFAAACRDVRREAATGPGDEDLPSSWEALAREPSPQEAAILTETLSELLQPLNAREREILTLRLEGYSIPEISQQVARSERTIHRVIDDVRKRLVVIRG